MHSSNNESSASETLQGSRSRNFCGTNSSKAVMSNQMAAMIPKSRNLSLLLPFHQVKIFNCLSAMNLTGLFDIF
jgi:hypothetical protein